MLPPEAEPLGLAVEVGLAATEGLDDPIVSVAPPAPPVAPPAVVVTVPDEAPEFVFEEIDPLDPRVALDALEALIPLAEDIICDARLLCGAAHRTGDTFRRNWTAICTIAGSDELAAGSEVSRGCARFSSRKGDGVVPGR